MPRVTFTSQLRRFLDAPPVTAAGATLAAVLNTVFAANPRLRGYILEDNDSLRRHIMIFINGAPLRDRITLSDPVAEDADIHVLAALSGG